MNSIISTYIFVSLAIAAVQCQQFQRAPMCPEFLSRYESENLVITLDDECDMVVGTQYVTRHSDSNVNVPNTGSDVFTPARGFYLPVVTYRRPENLTSTDRVCPPYTVRYLGPRVVVDTVPNTCQKVIGIKTFQSTISGNGSQGPLGMMVVARAVFENLEELL
ncbi:uncharacterized protein LOC117343155 [Pecten maximus]|uniref:uncharacterized protein LOC117343155 n=1 Tax=Pecten maximus TaxID=6579 RepID=UPI00145842C1|nr:uncharacterized protein LOC117343155 [Pecten maximus]